MRAKIRPRYRLPIIVDAGRQPTALHAGVSFQRCIVGHLSRYGEVGRHFAIGCHVATGKRQGGLLEYVVPNGTVHVGNGIVHETHRRSRRIFGINRNGRAQIAIVPNHGVDHRGISVHINTARLRSIFVGQVGGCHQFVVGNDILEQHAPVGAIDSAILASGVVCDDRCRQHQIFRMVFTVGPRSCVRKIHARAVAGRVVGNHASDHEARVVGIHAAAIAVGAIVVDQRALHAAMTQIHAAAVARRIVFGDDTVVQIGVGAVHVDARPFVGGKFVDSQSALRIAAANRHAVQNRQVAERRFALHRRKPHDVARIARQRPAVVAPFRIVAKICAEKFCFFFKFPRLVAALATFVLRCLAACKTAVDADAVAHPERCRIGRPADYLRLRRIGAGCYPHFARQSLRIVVGKRVDHALQVAGSIVPACAVACGARTDIADAACLHRLVLVGADVDRAAHACRIVNICIPVKGCFEKSGIAFVDQDRTFQRIPNPHGIRVDTRLEVAIESGAHRRRFERRRRSAVVVFRAHRHIAVRAVGFGKCGVAEVGTRRLGSGQQGISPYHGIINGSARSVDAGTGVARDGVVERFGVAREQKPAVFVVGNDGIDNRSRSGDADAAAIVGRFGAVACHVVKHVAAVDERFVVAYVARIGIHIDAAAFVGIVAGYETAHNAIHPAAAIVACHVDAAAMAAASMPADNRNAVDHSRIIIVVDAGCRIHVQREHMRSIVGASGILRK